MLDRLISGAGAVAHLADRIVRLVGRGAVAQTQPVGIAIAGILGAAALTCLVLGVESIGDRAPHELGAGDAAASDQGSRTYASVSGGLVSAYVESFRDRNSDGQQQPDERSVAWIYFLVDPETKRGVTIESERSPADVYTYRTTGVVVDDADYVAEDVSLFKTTIDDFGLTLDARSYVDATKRGAGAPVAIADGLPAAGTAVEVAGARSVDYVDVCSTDTNNDGKCAGDEVDQWDVLVYDPVTKKGVTVLTAASPEFAPASFTGMLLRAPNRVSDSQRTTGDDRFSLGDFGVTLSPEFILIDGDQPFDPVPLFSIAIISGAIAATIALGAAGGYLRFRRGGAPPTGGPTMRPGDRIPLRVTGDLRTPNGLRHVRETPADLVRFVMTAVEPPSTDGSPESAASSPVEAPTTASSPVEVPTTLIIERRGRPEGVAVGRAELTSIEPGTAMPFRGPKPGLRLQTGTGPLVVSFDSVEDRDRAATELAVESGHTGGAS